LVPRRAFYCVIGPKADDLPDSALLRRNQVELCDARPRLPVDLAQRNEADVTGHREREGDDLRGSVRIERTGGNRRSPIGGAHAPVKLVVGDHAVVVLVLTGQVPEALDRVGRTEIDLNFVRVRRGAAGVLRVPNGRGGAVERVLGVTIFALGL